MKTSLFILIFFFLTGKVAYSQAVYTMPVTGTQTDTACGGIFYDSGGPSVNYANSANGTIVFCPAVLGQFTMMQFTHINLSDASDRLRIFSGSDTMSAPLATFAGPMTATGCITTLVSVDSSGGCLTAHFISNSVSNAAGWRALLYCNPIISAIPSGTNCANPDIIPSIPFTDTNQCTECMINDYQTQPGICNIGNAGEDRVYQYTAAGPETVCITMSSTTGNPTLAIYQGCPGAGGVCLTSTPMVGNDTMQVTFPVAGTYYIIIDEPSGYSCYDLSIVSCIVGIVEQENSADGVLIFPNPVTNELRIENAELKIKKVEFYNVFGEKNLSHQLKANSQKQITVDVSYFDRGIYFVRITDDKNYFVTRKIIKI